MNIHLKFSCKWTLDFDCDYVFVDRYNFLVNLKTMKIIDQVSKGGSIGYVVKGKFYTLKKLRDHLKKIKNNDCPF